MRNERGITLVALILIIVVLLILAGISISLVVNNEANQITIEPNNQVNAETQYNEQELDNANEVQEDLNEVENNDLNNSIDGNVVNIEAKENTVVNEENTVEANVVEANVVQ